MVVAMEIVQKMRPMAEINRAGPTVEINQAGPTAEINRAGPTAEINRAGPTLLAVIFKSELTNLFTYMNGVIFDFVSKWKQKLLKISILQSH